MNDKSEALQQVIFERPAARFAPRGRRRRV
jgi:hypothetical protein